jgi:hypothetical protein
VYEVSNVSLTLAERFEKLKWVGRIEDSEWKCMRAGYDEFQMGGVTGT